MILIFFQKFVVNWTVCDRTLTQSKYSKIKTPRIFFLLPGTWYSDGMNGEILPEKTNTEKNSFLTKVRVLLSWCKADIVLSKLTKQCFGIVRLFFKDLRPKKT